MHIGQSDSPKSKCSIYGYFDEYWELHKKLFRDDVLCVHLLLTVHDNVIRCHCCRMFMLLDVICHPILIEMITPIYILMYLSSQRDNNELCWLHACNIANHYTFNTHVINFMCIYTLLSRCVHVSIGCRQWNTWFYRLYRSISTILINGTC